MIMRTRVNGCTITKQSYELNMSESNIKKIIARLKKKYDSVEKYSYIVVQNKQNVNQEMNEHVFARPTANIKIELVVAKYFWLG